MRRAEEIFRARRNKVINSSVVGKTLNSTGLVMCRDTRSTIRDIVILAEMRRSRRNGGSGVIIASTMPSTAIGTANSRQFTAVAEAGAAGRAAGEAGGRLRPIG